MTEKLFSITRKLHFLILWFEHTGYSTLPQALILYQTKYNLGNYLPGIYKFIYIFLKTQKQTAQMLPRAIIGMRQKREMMTGDQLAASHTSSELVQPRPSLHSHQPTMLAKSPPNQAVLGLKSSWWDRQRRFSSSHSQSWAVRQSMPSCSLQVFQSSNSQSPS